MVEGPGCKLNGEKIRAQVRPGQVVTGIRGGAPQPPRVPCPAVCPGAPGSLSWTAPLNSNKDSCWNFPGLLNGCVYSGVETLGKELFMYFGLKALRIHFGMNGFVLINPLKSKNQTKTPPVFEVQLTKDLICFYDSSVEFRNAMESKQKIRMMEDLDVCSPKFNFSRAENEVKKQKDRMLCDVLMDQNVLPGIGNIIKNEALFDSGLHPAVKVSQLKDEQTHHLVKMIRDFTILFYECRKTGAALYRHYKVYKRSDCGQCSSKITVCRLGENNRMTYFCPRCQKENPHSIDISKLPTRNNLIGWAYSRGLYSNECVALRAEEEWSCAVCTLINKPSAKECDACMTSRPNDTKKAEDDNNSVAYDNNLMKYPCNNFVKHHTEVKINRKTAFGMTTLVLTDLSNKSSSLESVRKPNEKPNGGVQNSPVGHICFNDAQHPSTEKGKATILPLDEVNGSSTFDSQSSLLSPAHKKMKTNHTSPELKSYGTEFSSMWNASNSRAKSGSELQVNMTDGTCTKNTDSPRCNKHNRLCVLRVVRKDGESKGRQFYACPLPKGSQCGFFKWADLSFPFCNHGKRSIMRTVLKIGPNNGRKFFVCPLGKDKQCDFFQWAPNGPGMQIIPGC
ncbi:endonuclease 8-like 3 isoform X1 [Monodelphis domestica]|uniref:endonuclease 8-like 3 isoform X1 n=1 Tax=Monodelphis domestica TaxID=13616 RepID=UPI0024E2721E|nr:endonuclease 8-like 3 isoform X1 [Monodelphis domestica]